MRFFQNKTKHSGIDKHLVRKYNASRANFSKKHICNAPFAALRFDLYGRVLVCCYNTSNVLGNYATQSIEEIWNGKAAHDLREHLAENDLNLDAKFAKINCRVNRFHL